MKTEQPAIDALEMSRRLRVRAGAKLRAMGRKERLTYLHRRLKLFKSRLRRQKAMVSSPR
jgi:hypothetical protein